MQCNIDQRGRRVRLVWGVMMLLVSIAIAAMGFAGMIGYAWAWGGGFVSALLGIFGIYESRKGWCAVRAMGFKTPV